jgi:hypothetical protein
MSYLVLAYKWCVNGPINFWLRLRCKYFLNFIIEWRVVFLWWFGCKKLWVHGYLIRTILEKFNFVLCFFMVQLLRIWLLLVITKKINKKKQTIMCGCHGFFFFFGSDRNLCMCLRKHMRNLSMFSLPLYTTKMIKILLWQMRWALFDFMHKMLADDPFPFSHAISFASNGHSLENKE